MSKEAPNRLYQDFWDYWQKRYIEAGYDQESLAAQFDRLRELEKEDPTGGIQVKRLYLGLFRNELDGIPPGGE